ncbi:MAG: phosphoribosylformylglycinamidine synthase subunit PurQ [Armatimonadetes bacterium]|nr:phosphoribosylformylglycinamidine synthase subunit PurQ [Armatimonadota bacterium]MBS1710710.1 phosphoribosylformylglycinamidine synthase subunit PurQ [Armatimonadota bacterium]MBX3108381.1 phosphoribosylformylglycinamidine synthase subunit PurQ [Fimbriimonadaceae bacterium]
MKIAVVQFPGSNCDQDALWSLREDLGVQSEYVWHGESSLAGFDGVFIPGGFTYGDYLRCGAIAARSPVMAAVQEFASAGRPVLGVCNGFQILCEAGILPGALMPNLGERFVCATVHLAAAQHTSPWTAGVEGVLPIPIAHGEGRYLADDTVLNRLEGEGLVAFRYCSESGAVEELANPNGSARNIAGIVNPAGNVLGMMPHPERATRKILGSQPGLPIIAGFLRVLATV